MTASDLTIDEQLAAAKEVAAESETKKEFEKKLEKRGIHFRHINWDDAEENRLAYDEDPEFAENLSFSFKTKSGAIVTIAEF